MKRQIGFKKYEQDLPINYQKSLKVGKTLLKLAKECKGFYNQDFYIERINLTEWFSYLAEGHNVVPMTEEDLEQAKNNFDNACNKLESEGGEA